jgi:hypothetical protein
MPILSKSLILGGYLGVFCGGVLSGTYFIFRREKANIFQTNLNSIKFASRALLIGTGLCCGTFIGIGALTMAFSGKTSIDDFLQYLYDKQQKIYDKNEEIEIENQLNDFWNEIIKQAKNKIRRDT